MHQNYTRTVKFSSWDFNVYTTKYTIKVDLIVYSKTAPLSHQNWVNAIYQTSCVDVQPFTYHPSGDAHGVLWPMYALTSSKDLIPVTMVILWVGV